MISKKEWLAGKLLPEPKLERKAFAPRPEAKIHTYAVCIHCQRHFGVNEGYVGEEVSVCDVCNG